MCKYTLIGTLTQETLNSVHTLAYTHTSADTQHPHHTSHTSSNTARHSDFHVGTQARTHGIYTDVDIHIHTHTHTRSKQTQTGAPRTSGARCVSHTLRDITHRGGPHGPTSPVPRPRATPGLRRGRTGSPAAPRPAAPRPLRYPRPAARPGLRLLSRRGLAGPRAGREGASAAAWPGEGARGRHFLSRLPGL